MPVRALLFDFNGTLSDDERAQCEIYRQLFAEQGKPLTPEQYIVVLIASVLGSFGTAGVPGTAVVMATVVLSAANLPLETIGYLYAIDRILDMMRTMTNVTGQMLVPVLVAKETGLLDKAVYDNPSTNLGVDELEKRAS